MILKTESLFTCVNWVNCLQEEIEHRIHLQTELAKVGSSNGRAVDQARSSSGAAAAASAPAKNTQIASIVTKVKREFGDKVVVMNDDLRFIQEVAKGETLAPEMDCMEVCLQLEHHWTMLQSHNSFSETLGSDKTNAS